MFCRMFCKPRAHNGIYSIHCKRCFCNMGNEHPFIPRGFGLKLLYKGMIPTWFQRTMFLFLSCFVSCFEGLIFLQFQKICFLHVSIMFFVTFHTCFLQVFYMFLKVFVMFFKGSFCITSFYNFFFYVSNNIMFCNLSSFVRHGLLCFDKVFTMLLPCFKGFKTCLFNFFFIF